MLWGCPGDLENPERFPDTPLPECTLDVNVETEILGRYCTGGGCHGSVNPESNLDLESPDVYARIRNHMSSCNGRPLLDHGNIPNSYMVEKITFQSPSCGQQMPPIGLVNPVERACIERWLVLSELNFQSGGADAGAEQQ